MSDDLREAIARAIEYDPLTGIFTNLASNGRRRVAGERAGWVNDRGYRTITFEGSYYREHRLAFLFMTGSLPLPEIDIDHINGDTGDNRWCNLRLASRSQNNVNSKSRGGKSRFRGVYANHGKWAAKIHADGKSKYLGTFDTEDAAAEAYHAAAQSLHGEFAKWSAGQVFVNEGTD